VSIIIPPEATLGVQRALAALDQRLTSLERQPSGPSPQDLAQLRTDLLKAVSDATRGTIFNPNQVFRGSGGAHAIGIVPDPGATAAGVGTRRVLTEDGTWQHPLTPVCLVTHSVNQNGGAGPVDFIAAFDTTIIDNFALHSTTVNNSRIACDRPGYWAHFASFRYDGNASGSYRAAYLKKTAAISGGTTVMCSAILPPMGTVTPDLTLFTVRSYLQNDYVELHPNHDATAAINVQSQVQYSPLFGAIFLGIAYSAGQVGPWI
jgi:hypothetical protein